MDCVASQCLLVLYDFMAGCTSGPVVVRKEMGDKSDVFCLFSLYCVNCNNLKLNNKQTTYFSADVSAVQQHHSHLYDQKMS